MSTGNDARSWLRANGHDHVADQIDELMARWRKRGVKTRRNWWDVLAGDFAGEAKAVDGVTFPVLAAARRRKGWPSSRSEIGAGDSAPMAASKSQASSQQRSRKRSTTSGHAKPLGRVDAGTKLAPASRIVETLQVSDFAHISQIDVELGNLTVLVGPQGSGKSLALQLFKLGIDRYEIVSALRDAGHAFEEPATLLDLYLGRGMGTGLRANSSIRIGNRELNLVRTARSHRGADVGRVFYIPAHRALLLADGWPAPFKRLTSDTPAVARLFSENLFTLFGHRSEKELFPVERRLKSDYRDVIDAAVYHGGRVRIDEVEHRYRLELAFGNETKLPFMTWTAGQREFTPLLLGLYHLMPPRHKKRVEGIDWVLIEEPEMGLHPRALSAVLLLVLELLWRGYNVVLSTHATLVLDVVFTLRTLAERTRRAPQSLFDAFGIRRYPATQKVLDAALTHTYKTFYFGFQNGTVMSKDISALDPSSPDREEAEWGGLTGFSSNFNRVLLPE